MSRVTVNQGAINRFFERSPVAGAGLPGLRSGGAERVAARMVAFVEREAVRSFRIRTGDLLRSFRPIVRPDPRGGVRVGVGSVSQTAQYLTEGTRPHKIPLRKSPYPLRSEPGHPQPLLGYPIFQVDQKGLRPNDFIRRGVNLAIGRVVP